MAASKKNTIPAVDATDKAINSGTENTENTANTTPVVDNTKIIHATLKGIGFDPKGFYSQWVEDSEDAIADLDKKIKKGKLTEEQKTAILGMFATMKQANTPKVKEIHVCPVDVASDYAVAWGIRQQMLAQYNAAKKAVDVLYCAILDETKLDLDEAKTAVVKAGFGVNAKNGTIATAKGKTDGEHGNAGTTRVQTGCTITVGDVSYNGWKDLAKSLVTSVFKGDDASCNYPVNTRILEKLVEMDLPVTVHITPTLVGGTKDAAMVEWNKSKLHDKLAEYPSIAVVVK
jgi:hypothetical protein